MERSLHELLEQYSQTENGNSRAHRVMKKAHTLSFKLSFFPKSLEHLAFVISTGGWRIKKFAQSLPSNKKYLRTILI